MKYMMMIASQESAPDERPELPEDGRKELYDRIGAYWSEHTAAGRIVGGDELQPSSTATTVRIAPDGGTSVTDGPFAEAKEVVGGYAILDVADLDEAIRVASGWPERGYGVLLEIRPIVER